MLSVFHQRGAYSTLPFIIWLISASRMSDNTLSTLMGDVPSRSVDSPKVNERRMCISHTPSPYPYRFILLLEDLDAAFTCGINRDSTSTGAPTAPTNAAAEANDGSTLSLSGLLNSLDGIAAVEGRQVRCFSRALRFVYFGFLSCLTGFFSPRPITLSVSIPR